MTNPSSSAKAAHPVEPSLLGCFSYSLRAINTAAQRSKLRSTRTVARCLRVGCLLGALVCAVPVAAESTVESEVDYVELTAVLVRDGEYQRAAEALKNVDAKAEDPDAIKYHTLRGMVALEQQQLEAAGNAFADAIKAGQTDPLIHLYRAQAWFGLERYADAIVAIEDAGEAVNGLSGAWLMRAHAQWMLGQKQPALDTLSEASGRFPDNTSFQRRQVFYLIEAGLYQRASDLGRSYLARVEGKPEDFVAIGTALRRARSYDEALRFLEAARIKHPADGNIVKALAQTWLERGDPLAAAELLVQQAERDPSLLSEAAELFRRAGHPHRALSLNARVPDSARKLKQRLGLLVELKRYDEVAGMENALYRVGLLNDEDLRYALAYAHFQGGDYERAEGHLTALKRPELFRKATELRRLMAECAESRWSCV